MVTINTIRFICLYSFLDKFEWVVIYYFDP